MASKKTLKFAEEETPEEVPNLTRKSETSIDHEEAESLSSRQSRQSVIKKRESRQSMSMRASSSRLSQMFINFKNLRKRSSVVLRPIERYLPTYQLDSKHPFNTYTVEALMEELVIDEMDNHKHLPFDDADSMNDIARSLSEEILNHIRAKDYDRYKIIVQVTIVEKKHQEYHQNAAMCWDHGTDSLARYVYDRANVIVIASAFGVYYD